MAKSQKDHEKAVTDQRCENRIMGKKTQGDQHRKTNVAVRRAQSQRNSVAITCT